MLPYTPSCLAVLRFRNEFFGSGDPDPTFQLVPDPDLVSDPKYIFYNMLDINFTFVLLPFKCARLLIMMIYKLFGDNFFDQKEFYIF